MTSPTTRDRQIFADQVRTLYAQLPVSVPAQIVGGALLVAAMWGHVSQPTLVVVRSASARIRCRGSRSTGMATALAAGRRMERWRAGGRCGAGALGPDVGRGGLRDVRPRFADHQAVLIVALLGVATGSITVIATDVMAFYAFAGAVVTPVLARTAWEGGATYLVLAAIGAVVLAAILACGRNLSKELARSLAVYYQNLELIEELQAQKAIAERARIEAETGQPRQDAVLRLGEPRSAPAAARDGPLRRSADAKRRTTPRCGTSSDSINSSVQALEALFSELLDIAKIDSGAMKPVLAPFALDEMFGA